MLYQLFKDPPPILLIVYLYVAGWLAVVLHAVVDLPPALDRGLDALAAVVVEAGELQPGVQVPPHGVPVLLLLLLRHGGPQLAAQHDLHSTLVTRTFRHGGDVICWKCSFCSRDKLRN